MTRNHYFRSLPAEEQANTLTHLAGVLFTLGVAAPLLVQSARHGWQAVLGTALFVGGMLMMYLSSTLYHVVLQPDHKRRLRVFDHVSIYVMIAGSYSVISLCSLGGVLGWTLCGFLWLCTLAGLVGKLLALGKYPRLSLALYLVMGWVALGVMVPMWRSMPHSAFWLVVAEGVCYTVGAWFFRLDEERAFYHAIWHVFILLGSICHTLAAFIILR